jgi:hypothetical protein
MSTIIPLQNYLARYTKTINGIEIGRKGAKGGLTVSECLFSFVEHFEVDIVGDNLINECTGIKHIANNTILS